MYFGDGTTPTYFVSKGEMVYFNNGKRFVVLENATLQWGELDGDWGINGSMWSLSPSAEISILSGAGGDGTFKIYASIFRNRSNNRISCKDAGDVDFMNCILSTDSTAADWLFQNLTSGSFKRVFVSKIDSVIFIGFIPTMQDVHIHSAANAVYGYFLAGASEDINVKDTLISNSTVDIKVDGNQNQAINMINPVVPISTLSLATATDMGREQYTFNIHVKDKDGTNLASVTCLLEDTDDNEIFSVSTAADGTITEQTVDYKKWTGTSETLTEYSPHKLTLLKANYETLVIPITMSGKKNLEYKLFPALAESDVREDVEFGEGKTGTLDITHDVILEDVGIQLR